MNEQYQEAEYVEVRKEGGGFSPFKTLSKLAFKIIFSPLIVFIVAYIYFQDTRKAFYVALLFYTGLTVLSIIWSFFQMFLAMATFNPFKLIKKSFKIVYMLVALAIYWGAYILMWGSDFSI